MQMAHLPGLEGTLGASGKRQVIFFYFRSLEQRDGIAVPG